MHLIKQIFLRKLRIELLHCPCPVRVRSHRFECYRRHPDFLYLSRNISSSRLLIPANTTISMLSFRLSLSFKPVAPVYSTPSRISDTLHHTAATVNCLVHSSEYTTYLFNHRLFVRRQVHGKYFFIQLSSSQTIVFCLYIIMLFFYQSQHLFSKKPIFNWLSVSIYHIEMIQ